jgi:hypothetical protein
MSGADDTEKTRRKFHLEEYKTLRAEILAQHTKYRQTKLLLLAALLAAVYSWIYTNLFSIESH